MLAERPVPIELRTPRLRLTRIGREHLDDLVTLDADPGVMRYLHGPPNTRDDYERELLARMMAWEDRPYGFLAAYLVDGSMKGVEGGEGAPFVGWFHLRPSVAEPSMLELGYRLRTAAWGRGLATEGSRAVLRHAFETLGEPAVDACADPRNVASTRVMEKVGMRRVDTFVHPRIPIEVVRYLVERGRAVLDPR